MVINLRVSYGGMVAAGKDWGKKEGEQIRR